MGKKQKLIQESFSSLSIEMIKSPARWVLNQTERRILDCFEVELSKQGRKYVPLVITYETLIAFGIDRGSIAPAMRVLEDLGFILNEHGRADNGGEHKPNKILLTYAYTDKNHLPTHNWREVKSKEDAERIRKGARVRKDPRAVARGKKYNPTRRRLNIKTDNHNRNIRQAVVGDKFSALILDEDDEIRLRGAVQ